MSTVYSNYSLKALNTFGMDVCAQYFRSFESEEELANVLREARWKDIPKMILGGGSNILFCQDFAGLVLKNNLRGIRIINESESHFFVEAKAGEAWHDFVMYCVAHEMAGVENLSLIPGSVGASPMQNIGAYGVEIKDVFHSLHAMHIDTQAMRIFSAEDCAFGYRESVFKKALKGQYIITSVIFCLAKKFEPKLGYGAIKETLAKANIANPSIKEVSDAVIAIRQSKLPDPAVLGNAGSFFKNPEIDRISFEKFNAQNPDAPYYALANEQYKIPAGWLIEQCGWKGKRVGETGSHKDQALVLVNYGQAKGAEIWQLALDIQASVQAKFGIRIEPEVNIC